MQSSQISIDTNQMEGGNSREIAQKWLCQWDKNMFEGRKWQIKMDVEKNAKYLTLSKKNIWSNVPGKLKAHLVQYMHRQSLKLRAC